MKDFSYTRNKLLLHEIKCKIHVYGYKKLLQLKNKTKQKKYFFCINIIEDNE